MCDTAPPCQGWCVRALDERSALDTTSMRRSLHMYPERAGRRTHAMAHLVDGVDVDVGMRKQRRARGGIDDCVVERRLIRLSLYCRCLVSNMCAEMCV